MPKLKLGVVTDDKPVKITTELPGTVHRDLVPSPKCSRAKPAGRSMSRPN